MNIDEHKDLSARPGPKLSNRVGKILIGTAITFMSVGFSVSAQARDNGHGYYGGHHSGYGHGYRRHHGYSNRGGYLVGGLVLGSLLSHAYHRNYEPYDRRYDRRYVVRESTVVRSSTETELPISRRLYKDRHGDCYERNYSPAGDEILVELDPSECVW